MMGGDGERRGGGRGGGDRGDRGDREGYRKRGFGDRGDGKEPSGEFQPQLYVLFTKPLG